MIQIIIQIKRSNLYRIGIISMHSYIGIALFLLQNIINAFAEPFVFGEFKFPKKPLVHIHY